MYCPELDAAVVGSVIADVRNQKGLSQEVLSGLAGIGRTHLSAIEHGLRKPTMETFYRLSIALNTSMSVLCVLIEERMRK